MFSLRHPRRTPCGRPVVRSWGAIAVSMAVLLSACSGSGGGDGGGDGAGKAPASTITSDSPELASPIAVVRAIVSGLQLDLQVLGYHPDAVSGEFTEATQKALRKFQTDAGTASEHGAVGPATAKKLEARLPGASEALRALQSALTDIGIYEDLIDGRYSAGTLAAVKKLQRQTDIDEDGFFGPSTARALARLYAEKVPGPPTGVATSPTPTPAPGAAPADLLKLGATGAGVSKLQERLTALGYRPGAVDGVYSERTASAVLALQKHEGISRDGVAGPTLQSALASPTGAGPRNGLPTPRIEVDIVRQVAFVVLASQPVITLNVSTGNGKTYKEPGGGTDVAYTPVGSFTTLRKINGERKAPLGSLHNPLYFYKGWAIHGAASVPAYPASHGCVRVSISDSEWLFPLIAVGTPIVVYDTSGQSPGPDQAPAGAAPGY